MITVAPGAILWALVPNPQNKQWKERPVLVISCDDFQETGVIFAAGITTKFGNPPKDYELPVRPTKANGLKVSSAINFNWLIEIPVNHVRRKLGVMDEETMDAVWDYFDTKS